MSGFLLVAANDANHLQRHPLTRLKPGGNAEQCSTAVIRMLKHPCHLAAIDDG